MNRDFKKAIERVRREEDERSFQKAIERVRREEEKEDDERSFLDAIARVRREYYEEEEEKEKKRIIREGEKKIREINSGAPWLHSNRKFSKRRRKTRRRKTRKTRRRKMSKKGKKSKKRTRRKTRTRRKSKKWIQNINMKKGSLRRMAPKDAFTKRGTLKVSWLKKAAKNNGILGKRARLALNLRKSRKGRKSRRKSRRK